MRKRIVNIIVVAGLIIANSERNVFLILDINLFETQSKTQPWRLVETVSSFPLLCVFFQFKIINIIIISIINYPFYVVKQIFR